MNFPSSDISPREQLSLRDSLLAMAVCSPNRTAHRSTPLPLVLLPFAGIQRTEPRRSRFHRRGKLTCSSTSLLSPLPSAFERDSGTIQFSVVRAISTSNMSLSALANEHEGESAYRANNLEELDDSSAAAVAAGSISPSCRSNVSHYRSQLDLRFQVFSPSTAAAAASELKSPRRSSLQLHSTTAANRSSPFATLSSLRRRPAYEVLSILSSIRQLQIDSEIDKRLMNELNGKLAAYIDRNRLGEERGWRVSQAISLTHEESVQENSSYKEDGQVQLIGDKPSSANAENSSVNCVFGMHIETLRREVEQLRTQLEEEMKIHDASRSQCESLNGQLADSTAELRSLKFRVELLQSEREQLIGDKTKLISDLSTVNNELEREKLECLRLRNHLQVSIDAAPRLAATQTAEKSTFTSGTNGSDAFDQLVQRPVDQLSEDYQRDLALLRSRIQAEFDEAHKETTEVSRLTEELKRSQMLREKAAAETAHYKCLCDEMQLTLDGVRLACDDAVRQLQEQNSQLQRIADAKQGEIERLLEELQILMQTKCNLVDEIATYRRLVELTQSRTESGTQTDLAATMYKFLPERHVLEITVNRPMHQIASYAVGLDDNSAKITENGDSSSVHMNGGHKRVNSGAMLAQTHCYRRSFGHIEIKEYGFDGSFLFVRNSGWREEQMGGWTILSQVDDAELLPVARLPKVILAPGQTLKVWANAAKRMQNLISPEATKEVEVDAVNFGVGTVVGLFLMDDDKHVRAEYKHKTVYASVDQQ